MVQDEAGLKTTWNRRSPERFEEGAIAGARVAAIASVAQLAGEVLKPGDVVLDVGCGVGLLAIQLPSISVIGVDFSSSLLARAKKRLPVAQGSVFALPVADRAIGVVTCLFVLDDYDTTAKRAAIRHLARVVRVGGSVIVAGYAPDDERMGSRRREVSDGTILVHLEDEPFYRDALAAISDTGTVRIEHIRTQGHSLIDGIVHPMQRHFILAVTTVSHRAVGDQSQPEVVERAVRYER
jgi:SAM-dependent methyltransferase